MQTFLPYPDRLLSAGCLDRQRQGKQRVEVLQILKALKAGDSPVAGSPPAANIVIGWVNHPAVRMWRGHSGFLALYGLCVCQEWTKRGYIDTCAGKILSIASPDYESVAPSWFGNDAFHAAHRSNLLRKNYAYYSQFGWTEPLTLPYIWPEP